MLLYLLMVILLCVREGKLQECKYDVLRNQTATGCIHITTNDELRKQINDTLSPYGNITWIINKLFLTHCNMLNLAVDELRFLSQLKEILIVDSNIRTLYFGNSDEAVDDNGMYVRPNKAVNNFHII
ncbi:hypothetical protein ILUMI_18245 [Ignelater luminosus]|uniref:Receptor L-domain domain-containing protein n=1 Tax=Ignelater luminosus TaxID=2038154 RepID=A0A8K0CNZ1_IGNLU|nr:hypothetical protein ILUMI_18245 [Ignelater luminosus]